MLFCLLTAKIRVGPFLNPESVNSGFARDRCTKYKIYTPDELGAGGTVFGGEAEKTVALFRALSAL